MKPGTVAHTIVLNDECVQVIFVLWGGCFACMYVDAPFEKTMRTLGLSGMGVTGEPQRVQGTESHPLHEQPHSAISSVP